MAHNTVLITIRLPVSVARGHSDWAPVCGDTTQVGKGLDLYAPVLEASRRHEIALEPLHSTVG